MTEKKFTPAAWLTVLLAAIPGLLVVISRSNATRLVPLFQAILGLGYLGLLLIGAPIIWRRTRRFPAWALLPAGLLLWMAVYTAGALLSQWIDALGLFPQMRGAPFGMVILQLLISVVLLVLLLKGKRLPLAGWLAGAALLALNLGAAVYYSSQYPAGGGPAASALAHFILSGLFEGLMLVAAGLLAVRQHGLRALLVVIGGFGFMTMDSDYLWGFFIEDWAGYTAYMVAMVGLYWLVPTVGLLRARTRLGSALAVFIPLGVFHVARNLVPMLVLPELRQVPWGDILLSVNVLLTLLLAFLLYDHLEQAAPEPLPSSSAPLPAPE